MIQINDAIVLDEAEIEERFIRASGPGVQNVNKVATAVELRFDVGASSLPAAVKERLTTLAGSRMTTEGVLIIGHAVGWKLYGPRNKLVAERTGSVDLAAHHDNFLECIRSDPQRLHADAMTGHLAATICHLANISARVGRTLTFDPEREEIRDDREAAALVRRKYRAGHWAVPRG